MPLLNGYSRATIKHNIQKLCRETKCEDLQQHRKNVAIALAQARRSWERYGVGDMPAYLKGRKK